MYYVLSTFYRYLWRYPRWMVIFTLSLAALVMAENLEPYFSKLLVDNISTGNLSIIPSVIIAFGLARVSSLIFESLMRASGDLAVLPAARDVRLDVVKNIHDLDFAFHTSRSTGSLISLIKRGDGAFFDFFHSINIGLSRVALGFVVMMYFLLSVRWEIAILVIVSFGLAGLSTKYLIANNIKTRRNFNQAEDEISDIIVDNLINFETVKLFSKEKAEQTRLAKSFETWVNQLWKYAQSFRLLDITVGFLGNSGFIVCLFVGFNWIKAGEITIGEYVMVLSFITSFYNKFFELTYSLRNIAKNLVDIEKYFAIFKYEIEVKDPVRSVNKSSVSGLVEFKNITFRYGRNNKAALTGINLTVKPGQSVAFVGKSGVGKTTLVKLLMRFYDPTKGQILIDNVNIKRFSKSRLRSFMGVVPQEPILFNDTIAYNIAYGCKNTADNQQIVAAAKMANLHDFIDALPEKYQTKVGERGVKLSGGQKQRLAIARMILSDPDIVIFDEATSQLDSESEKLIQDAFWKAIKNKTTFIIAHRLSTIVKAEKIVVMKEGRIVEIGSHRQLISRPGSLYSHYWQLQSASFSNSAEVNSDANTSISKPQSQLS